MEIKTLKTFLVVAEVGTISHAATLLHCVQSNVTSRVKTLEEELGVELFLRSRSGMALSAAGELFLPYAQNVIESEVAAAAAMKNFSSAVKLLRLGSMETTLAVRLPPHIAAFRAAHSSVKLNIQSGPTDDLIVKILNKTLDIAFIGGTFAHPDISAHIAYREEMVLVTDLDINNAQQAGLAPVIVFKSGCSYRAFSQMWMRKSGLSPNDVFELGTLDGILGCVASGVGVTLLPRSVVETSRHYGTVNIHTLKGKERFIDTYAIYNTAAAPNGAVSSFINMVCQDESAPEMPNVNSARKVTVGSDPVSVHS